MSVDYAPQDGDTARAILVKLWEGTDEGGYVNLSLGSGLLTVDTTVELNSEEVDLMRRLKPSAG